MSGDARQAVGADDAGGHSSAILVLDKQSLAREEVARAVADVRAAGFELDIAPTESAEGTIARIAEQAGRPDRTVIVGGGDGTLNVLAQAIAQHELRGGCFGLLPLGTANDFAAAAEIPADDLACALRIAMSGPAKPVDLAFVNDRPFLNAVTIGQPAEFSRALDPKLKARFGRWAYMLSSLKQINEIQCVETEVVAGTFEWSGPSFGVLVGNGRQVGGGFALSTTAKINDGLLDGMVIPEMPMRHWAELALNMHRDSAAPELDGDVPSWRGPDVTVRFDRPQPIQIDGEPGQAQTLRFRIDRHRFSFRLPAHTDLA